MIRSHFLGSIPYLQGLELQEKYLAEIKEQNEIGRIIFCEHPDVLTLGKNSDARHIHENLPRHIPIHRVDRGGEVTAHMPGQLVIYPLLNLKKLPIGARDLVSALEQSLIELCQSLWGVQLQSNPKRPGVWFGDQKVASIGLRFKNHMSCHGVALNIQNSLDIFHYITPCGIESCEMTRMNQLSSNLISLPKAACRFSYIFAKIIDVPITFAKETYGRSNKQLHQTGPN